MKNKNTRNWFILVAIILISIILTTMICSNKSGKNELKTVKTDRKLEQIYEGERISNGKEALIRILGMPFSLLYNFSPYQYANGNMGELSVDSIGEATNSASSLNPSTTQTSNGSSKDYSTTNIQVENVDEADITKTDGDYIYSISEDNIVITDVRNPKEIKLASKITSNGDIPEDLILYQNHLVVICTQTSGSSISYYYNNKNNTVVKIYDITDKEHPTLEKQYMLYEPYYTSRCIDNKLYVIASGNLRKENNRIVTYYSEDLNQKEIGLDNIKYLKDVKTKKQTLISMLDLNEVKKDIVVNSYLIDISNAYVSENHIYLLDEEYERKGSVPPISSLFGFWGAIGPFKYRAILESNYDAYTKIYKFTILKDGKIQYDKSVKTKGRSINQYSVDEYDNCLRLAVYDNSGSRVVIFDKNLNEIGKTREFGKR